MAKILIADDDEMNRDVLSRRLRRKGYDVVVACDGEEVVVMAASEQPDLILMDLSMPVLNGWQATEKIKADATTQHIPVLAFTSHKINGEDAMMAGFDGYALKPVELESLLGQMEKLLGNG